MTEAPLYESLIADGTIDRRHELALMRFGACYRAAEKAGWRCFADDPDFLKAQFAFLSANLCLEVRVLAETLIQPQDPEWTLADLSTHFAIDPAHHDPMLEAVGDFLAIDHPAEYREWKARQEAEYARWAEHPDERPAFLRRERERA